MGCGASVEKEIPREWYTLFRRMCLTNSEVTRLLSLFKQYQSSATGSLDIVEWLTLIDLERNHLTERIFTVSDRNGDERLNFFEFVLSLWKFCILGDHSLSTNFQQSSNSMKSADEIYILSCTSADVFAFDMYDLDSDGVLTNHEVHVMFRELLGETMSHSETDKL
jgi:Ca2+-binding EF-hand superfamily protein